MRFEVSKNLGAEWNGLLVNYNRLESKPAPFMTNQNNTVNLRRRNWTRGGMAKWNGIFRLELIFGTQACEVNIQNSENFSGKFLLYSIPNPEIPDILAEWKAPIVKKKKTVLEHF